MYNYINIYNFLLSINNFCIIVKLKMHFWLLNILKIMYKNNYWHCISAYI